MAPVGPNGEPIEDQLISHKNNSYTIVPRIVNENTKYLEEYV